MKHDKHKDAVDRFIYNENFRAGNVEVIVKVLLTLDGIWVHDRDGILNREQDLTNEISKQLARDTQAFFYAKWDKVTREWVIGDRAPDQSW